MADNKELNLEELEEVSGGFEEGRVYTVRGTDHYLGFRNNYEYDDSNIIRKYHNGDELVYRRKAPNGYVLVEDPEDGKLGYVNSDYLKEY